MSTAKRQKTKAKDDQLPVAEAMEVATAPILASSAGGTKHTFALADGKDTLVASQTSRVVVEVYTNTILTQVNMAHLVGVDGIEEHEASAKKHAATWIPTVAPTIIQTNQDIIDFGNKFNNFLQPLNAALDTILANQPVDSDTPDVAAKKAAAVAKATAEMQTGLTLLLGDIATHRTNAETASSTLSTFLGHVQDAATNFATDYEKVQAVYMGDTGMITSLGNQIASLHKGMARDSTQIALGSATVVVGLLAIASGLLLEIPSGFTSTAIVVGGVVVAGAGATAGGMGKATYDKQAKALAQAVKDLATDTAEVAIAGTLKLNLVNLQTTGNAARDALIRMVTQWQTLEATIKGVYNDFNGVTPEYATFIQAELDTGAKVWKKMQQQASLIADQMVGNPTVAFDNVSDITKDYPLPVATIKSFANPVPLFARTVGADAVATTASDGGLVDAISRLESDITHLHVAITAPGMAGLPAAEKLVSMVASLPPMEQALLANLAATAKAHGDINHLASETDNEVIGLAAQSFLAALQGGLVLAKDLSQASVRIHGMSTEVTSEALTSIHDDDAMMLGGKVKLKALQSEIVAVKRKLRKDRAIIAGVSFVFGLAGSVIKQIGELVINQKHILMKIAGETKALETQEGDLEKMQANLDWITAVHAAVSDVTSSSLRVATAMQTIVGTVTAVVENKATSGSFALATLVTIAQDFASLEALISGSKVSTPSMASVLLMSGPQMALSVPMAVPVERFDAPAVTVSVLSGGSDAMDDMSTLVGDLCGQVWIGNGASLVVASQSQLSLNLLPTIGETQALAANHAREWASIVRKEIINVTIAVGGFSAASEAVVSMMLELIRTRADDKLLETQLLQGVETVSNRLSALADTLNDGAIGAIPAVNAMRRDLTNDTIRVGSLRTQLATTYTGPGGEIARLTTTLEASSARITAMNKAIVNRATTQLCEFLKQGFIIAAGVGLAVVGVPLGPIIGGIASEAAVATCSKFATMAVNAAGKKIVTTGSQAALEAISGSDQNDVGAAIEQYGTELVELKLDELQVGAFLVLAQGVEDLVSSLGETALTLIKLNRSVTSLASELKLLTALIPDKSSAKAVKDKLVAMQAGHSKIQLNAEAATKSIIFTN